MHRMNTRWIDDSANCVYWKEQGHVDMLRRWWIQQSSLLGLCTRTKWAHPSWVCTPRTADSWSVQEDIYTYVPGDPSFLRVRLNIGCKICLTRRKREKPYESQKWLNQDEERLWLSLCSKRQPIRGSHPPLMKEDLCILHALLRRRAGSPSLTMKCGSWRNRSISSDARKATRHLFCWNEPHSFPIISKTDWQMALQEEFTEHPARVHLQRKNETR